MKSTKYTLTDVEQKDLKLELLEPDSIAYDDRATALLHAGVDRYIGGVGFFRLQADWRGHKAGALVVRHLNSSGTQVTVCEPDRASSEPIASTSTPAGPSKAEQQAAAAAAAADVAELEAKRQAQAAKDAPPANDNKEPAPATGTNS